MHLVKLPFSTKNSSWERNAKLVKNTDVTNQYLEHIRETHDPSLHIKTLEEEIRGTMSQALKKQGDKILYYKRLMDDERAKYNSFMQQMKDDKIPTFESNQVIDCSNRYNDYRKQAITARWELMVHRQAIGMIVNNHNFVHKMFPIDDALEIPDIPKNNETLSIKSVEPKKPIKKFGDQLDWWQSIGRWK
jgi:hypothetical protein